jgi:broad specificity phosphatase PhoE
MRTLDVRRHTMRRKPGPHLTQEGVDLARLVAENAGDYDFVATSTLPRAVETAIAMGFAADETIEEFGQLPDDVHREIGWPSPFALIARAVARGGAAARYAQAQAGVWRQIVDRVPDGGRALVIGHGLIVELGAIGSVPNADRGSWGDALGYCEGVRVTFGGNDVRCEILRVPEEHRLVEN